MKILLLGSSGMLGSDCKLVLEKDNEIVAPSRKELDIVRWDAVIDTLDRVKADVVINCAAFTDVDACEADEPWMRKVSVEGPRNLAQGCARFHAKFLHISSDYVFDGRKAMPQPYFEDDPPRPLSVYGRYKVESEVAVRDNSPNYILVRTGWLYGLNGKNFVKSIISQTVRKDIKKIQVVSDQYGSPTWTYRLALQIKKLIENDARGTYHVTSEEYCTPYDWARQIIEKLKLKVKLERSLLKDQKRPAKRPVNCVLENRKLKEQGLNIMRPWKEDLHLFLEKYGPELVKEAREE
ncbi:MAG: dTDP-4-dehydrorhamnose reductase [Deltaproteobacteria bacterium]|nr:dTDP-4-dehydrorhamnose reductase [Deltaproteobacteria bacterium]MBW2082094.1 dTDP-4-dehydrorhamnose reductase [Deltaproteobacteria bacterium]HDM10293.1 dTDP-4-dehydrorhamnose reductase [Desulfobacteraceae bacterium]